MFQHHSRDEYKKMIEANGGKNVGSISKNTSFILAGDNMGPAKLEKAQKLGVQIMGEDEFLDIIGNGNTGNSQATDDMLVEDKDLPVENKTDKTDKPHAEPRQADLFEGLF